MSISIVEPEVESSRRLGDGGLTLMEFAMHEPLPLSAIQDAVFEFLRGRDDAVVFGAQAVNAYVAERRSTEDVDVASSRGEAFAEELRAYLGDRFKIAVRVRNVRDGLGFRIYQVRRDGNRHLVDVRPVIDLPPFQEVDGIRVVTPPELIAGKLRAFVSRQGKPKSFTDRRDLAVLLLRFPELKTDQGLVLDSLCASDAPAELLHTWREVVSQEILPEDEDAGW
jgi:hypothetical protein